MKVLTRKQRREIYLNIAGGMSEYEGAAYLCGWLSDATKIGISDLDGIFPEFERFKPTFMEREGYLLWWSGSASDEPNYNYNVRIICMLLCAEMCND